MIFILRLYCSRYHSDDDIEVRESALHAVAKITEKPDGARAVGNAKVWEYLPEHLDFSNSQMEQSWSSILSNLANYGVEVLGMEASRWVLPRIFRKTSLIVSTSNTDIDARRDAVYMLSEIGYRPHGAQAGAGALKYVPELLVSADTQTRGWTCKLVGAMAFYRFTSAAQLGVESCTQIVALLG